MRPLLFAPLVLALLFPAQPRAETTGLAYRARVVHNNRAAVSEVSGLLDLSSGDYQETIDASYKLNWEVLPAQTPAQRASMPSIWQQGGLDYQQLGSGMPRVQSPLLRHFITGQVLANPAGVKEGSELLNGQLLIHKVSVDERRLEITGSFRGSPLVLAGKLGQVGGRAVATELAVLGATGELYHYFIPEEQWRILDTPPLVVPPQIHPEQHVSFSGAVAAPVPVTAVKDWLIFEASLPGGRKLNLLLDSGADTMIVDDMVLELDAKLSPAGEADVEGALAGGKMKVYDGFSFSAGGVEFKNLTVLGAPMTSVGLGAGIRIHGIVGGQMLALCRADVDLQKGEMRLSPPGADLAGGQALPITFIQDLPHIQAQFGGSSPALFLLDTGQRSAVSVNMDYLQTRKLDNNLVMNGFLGDMTGGLAPRYMLENQTVGLAGQQLTERMVDATPSTSFNYAGLPVAGAFGFSLLARHFGGFTFDYSAKLLYLRNPGAGGGLLASPMNPPAQSVLQSDPASTDAAALLALSKPEEPGQVPVAGFDQSPVAAGTTIPPPAASQPTDPPPPSFDVPEAQGSSLAVNALSGNNLSMSEAASVARTSVPPPAVLAPSAPRIVRWERYDAGNWADPPAQQAAPDPASARRAKYAWSTNKGNLSDPLSLVKGSSGDGFDLMIETGQSPQGIVTEDPVEQAEASPAFGLEGSLSLDSLMEALRISAANIGAALLGAALRLAH